MSNLEDMMKEGKMLIQNLSKMDFSDKNLANNILLLLIIYCLVKSICEGERERERALDSAKTDRGTGRLPG